MVKTSKKNVKKVLKSRKVIFDDDSVQICFKIKGNWLKKELKEFRLKMDESVQDYLKPTNIQSPKGE